MRQPGGALGGDRPLERLVGEPVRAVERRRAGRRTGRAARAGPTRSAGPGAAARTRPRAGGGRPSASRGRSGRRTRGPRPSGRRRRRRAGRGGPASGGPARSAGRGGRRGPASRRAATLSGSLVGRSPVVRGRSTPDATSTPTTGADRDGVGDRCRRETAGEDDRELAGDGGDERRRRRACPCRRGAGRRPCRGAGAPRRRRDARGRGRRSRPAAAGDVVGLGGGQVERLPGRPADTRRSARAAPRRTAGPRRGRAPRRSPRSRSSPASAVIATTCGAPPDPADSARATRRSSTASSSDSSRGVPGTRFSPIASAPARIAASTPSASVTPQIFTNGRFASLAGSARLAAGLDERRDGRGRVRRADERLSDERRVEADGPPAGDGRRVADAGLGDDEPVVGDELAQADGPLHVDVERPQVAVVQADEPRVRRQRPVELPLVVGLDQRLQADLERPVDERRETLAPDGGPRAAAPGRRRRRGGAAAGSPRRRTPSRGPGS